MPLKPWFKVVTPREDLRDGKPLDAAEFAVHLEKVRDQRAPRVYQDPEQFFSRTFLTASLTDLGAEMIRRLSGERTGTSAVFNLATQFGGGKTHALTLLYHLATHGPASERWVGVDRLLKKAEVPSVPCAATAVFVGTEFDSLTGRGGVDGTPRRRTPWGEIAFQLGGEAAFAVVAEHDEKGIAPGGDVIRAFLPADRPCLILMDELMNYVSRNRRSGLATQLYDFLQTLSEEARGRDRMVLAVSVPASELEMTAEDHGDYERIKKLLDRLGKAIVMSAESETSEIIRRRLFEWDERAVTADGRVLLPREAIETCAEMAGWVQDHRLQLPQWFPFDHAREAFAATYPFHPMVLSVFERKWQALPRFQQTRGVLRLLALWVSRAFQDAFKGAHRDSLIGLGTAPLDEPMFRAAMFEQLGEHKLEGAVTTDICGKAESHATRLDAEAPEPVRKARLHRKVATAIFFESNGGMARGDASVPEVRLAVVEPGLDIGNVETVLDSLASSSYFLTVDKNRYRFSPVPNLNKLLADRRGNVKDAAVRERVRDEIRKVMTGGKGMELVLFPESSNDIPNLAVLTLVVMPPSESLHDEARTMGQIESFTRTHGGTDRTFKSALVFAVADSPSGLDNGARALLAWEAIEDEAGDMRLDESQRRQLAESAKKATRDLREAVWRTYKHLLLLGRDGALRRIDLGLVHSSASASLVRLYLDRLRQEDEVTDFVAPSKLVKHWPGMVEWSTRAVRDVFFASPLFPRLMRPDAVKEIIARGVTDGQLALVGKRSDGSYNELVFEMALRPEDVEVSDDTYVLRAEDARRAMTPPVLTRLELSPAAAACTPGEVVAFAVKGWDQHGREMKPESVRWTASGGTIEGDGALRVGEAVGAYVVQALVADVRAEARVTVSTTRVVPQTSPRKGIRRLRWSGDVPAPKWMTFYSKVLTAHAKGGGVRLRVTVEVEPPDGLTDRQVEETKVALRELGLPDEVVSE